MDDVVLELGLPKGRMQAEVLKLMADAGLPVKADDRGYRPIIGAGDGADAEADGLAPRPPLRGQVLEAPEHRRDDRPRKPRRRLRRRRLDARARVGRGGASRYGPRSRPGRRRRPHRPARERQASREARPRRRLGVRDDRPRMDVAQRSRREVRAFLRGDGGLPPGGRRRDRGQLRHGLHPQGQRPRDNRRGDAKLDEALRLAQSDGAIPPSERPPKASSFLWARSWRPESA